MNLLFIDDDALVVSSARRALALLRPNWTLAEATSLPVALSLVSTLPAFDVIVCDLNLGPDSGLEVLRVATLVHPQTLRVLLSGDRAPLDLEAALVHATVRKPVSLSQLLTVIESLRPVAPNAA